MRDNTKMIIHNAIFTKSKIVCIQGLLVNLLIFKSKIKVTLIERQSLQNPLWFGIPGNRGSSQNFHEVSFSGDCKIITPSHTIIPIPLLIHTSHI